MKIFISIASYQDPLLETTVLSAFNNAITPENLHFGICDQSLKPLDISLFSFASQISYEHIDPKISEGPCWARHRIQNFYENEDYYFQIDSHRKTRLLEGLDDIDLTLKEDGKIENFEKNSSRISIFE